MEASAATRGQKPPLQPRRQVRILTEETGTSFGVAGLRFQLNELLGEGSFGAVYKCSKAVEGASGASDGPCDYAVKVMDARRLSMLMGAPVEMVCPRLEREVDILFLLGEQHPGILRLNYAFFSNTSHKFYLVTELCKGGDLFSAIVKRGKPFREKDGQVIFAQLVDAVAFCHSTGVAHRDLKLENCLFVDDRSLKVKVCDYGQAKVISAEGITGTAKTLTTTPRYTAPEVACAVKDSQSYDAYRADSFALGVMLYALLCNALPDAAKGAVYERHPLWPALSLHVRNLIKKLLTADPAQRPLPAELQEDPWVKYGPEACEVPADPLTPSEQLRGACTPVRNELVVESLRAIQELMRALQLERGTACRIVGSDEDDGQFQFQTKFTDERLDAAISQIVSLLTAQMCEPTDWVDVSEILRHCPSDLRSMRKLINDSIATREEALDLEQDINDIFERYCALLTRIMGALHELLPKLTQKVNMPRTRELRLRLLQVAAEQLARERGLVSGYLGRPERLRQASVFRRVAEVVGARKVLLGSVRNTQGVTGAGAGGLLTALGLEGSALLDETDLTALETVEDRAMNAKRSDNLAVAEWWYHISKAVDKVHHHILVRITEYSNDWSSSQKNEGGGTQ